MTQNERNCDGSRLVANQTEFQMNSPRQENWRWRSEGSGKLFFGFLKVFQVPF